MPGFFTRGIILEQLKEPALSREIKPLSNTNYDVSLSRDKMTEEQIAKLRPEQIIEIAEQANIIDERDGIPVHQKLSGAHGKGITAVVADAIDDEPYISSRLNPFLKNGQQVADALRLAARAIQAQNVYVAVYKNITDMGTKIPYKIDSIPVRRIRGRYPADFRVKEEFKEERKILLIGTGALIHLYRAVYENRVQTTTFLTAAGDCIATPQNLEVSLGMPVARVLECCGLAQDPNRVIVGGSMTGISVTDPEQTMVSPTSLAVLAFHEDEKNRKHGCIGCSRCVDNCPENLTPVYIYKYAQLKRYDQLSFYEIDRCVGCGTCSYSCPAKLDISTEILEAKEKLHQYLMEHPAAQKKAEAPKPKVPAKQLLEQLKAETAQRVRQAKDNRELAKQAREKKIEASQAKKKEEGEKGKNDTDKI